MSEPPSPRCFASRAVSAQRFGALVRADRRRPCRLRRAPDLIGRRSRRRAHPRLDHHTLDRTARAPRARPRRHRHAGQRLRCPRQPPRHPDPHRHVPRLSPRSTRLSVRTSPPRSCSRCRRRSCSRCSPRSIAVAFGVEPSISVVDFMVVSVVGALLSSLVVLVITVGVAASARSVGWDLDNVAAPIVTAAGDVATLPSLFVATYLLGIHFFTPVIAGLCAIACSRRRWSPGCAAGSRSCAGS